MAKYQDQNGQMQEVELSTKIYQEAQDQGVSVSTLLNQQHPTKEGDASAFKQMCASLGLFVKNDPKSGIRATRLKDVINGTGPCAAAATVRKDVPESRILYQAAVLSTIEDKLAEDLETTSNAFDRMVAITENIEGNEFKRPILNYDQPEAARSQVTAQLAKPVNMLTLTASDRSLAIASEALGITWSDQAMQNTGLDVVALSVARQIAVQRDTQAYDNVLALLQGDEDLDMKALVQVANTYVATYELDEVEKAKTALTQTAWVKWLYRGRGYRRIDWVITDIDGALAIENRDGRPVITGDNPNSPRIDSQMSVANPLIPAKVNVFVTDHPNWPADTYLGLDSRYAIQRINSISSNYQAVDKDVITRSNTMRWDSGTAALRLFDQAFSVLEIATTPSAP